jgi:hypothetical protein
MGTKLTRPYGIDNAGLVSIMEAEILKSDAAARQLIGTIPPNSVVLDAWVEVEEAFNAGVSNLVTAGWGAIAAATADDLVSAVTEGTPGAYAGAGKVPKFAAATDLYLYYTPGAAGATTGRAHAYVVIARCAANGE